MSTAEQEFEGFVTLHAAALSRLAYVLLGDPDEADDLAGDVLLAAWRQWPTVRVAEHPLGYLRRATANMAASRIRRKQLARVKLRLLRVDAARTERPPSGDVVDVRRALARLAPRRRACVVLRLAFDLPEREVADLLRVSVGTVKSQTSKAVAQLRRLLGDEAFGTDHSSTVAAFVPPGDRDGGR
ncbi:MAG: SigE family RNA polymerase sigma factor [Angustibacter sp.]